MAIKRGSTVDVVTEDGKELRKLAVENQLTRKKTIPPPRAGILEL